MVPLIGFVEDAKTSVEGSTGDSEAVSRDVDGADRAFVLGLHEELVEVQGPDPEKLIFRARDTESLIDRNGKDGGIVGPVGCLERLIVVIHLIDHACLTGNIDSTQSILLYPLVACLLDNLLGSRLCPTQLEV